MTNNSEIKSARQRVLVESLSAALISLALVITTIGFTNPGALPVLAATSLI